jgi:hypothetical protein
MNGPDPRIFRFMCHVFFEDSGDVEFREDNGTFIDVIGEDVIEGAASPPRSAFHEAPASFASATADNSSISGIRLVRGPAPAKARITGAVRDPSHDHIASPREMTRGVGKPPSWTISQSLSAAADGGQQGDDSPESVEIPARTTAPRGIAGAADFDASSDCRWADGALPAEGCGKGAGTQVLLQPARPVAVRPGTAAAAGPVGETNAPGVSGPPWCVPTPQPGAKSSAAEAATAPNAADSGLSGFKGKSLGSGLPTHPAAARWAAAGPSSFNSASAGPGQARVTSERSAAAPAAAGAGSYWTAACLGPAVGARGAANAAGGRVAAPVAWIPSFTVLPFYSFSSHQAINCRLAANYPQEIRPLPALPAPSNGAAPGSLRMGDAEKGLEPEQEQEQAAPFALTSDVISTDRSACDKASADSVAPSRSKTSPAGTVSTRATKDASENLSGSPPLLCSNSKSCEAHGDTESNSKESLLQRRSVSEVGKKRPCSIGDSGVDGSGSSSSSRRQVMRFLSGRGA